MLFVSEHRVPRPLIAPARTEAELVSSLRAHRRADPLDFPILQTALDLSALACLQADRPLPDFGDVIDLMNEMAHFAGEWVAVYDGAPPVGEQVEWLAQSVSEVGAFRGIAQNYDASENADFASVIQNRRILPVSIGVLYIHLARSCNFAVEGLNFPGPFLLRMEAGDEQVIFDPSAGARPASPQDLRALLKRHHGEAAELDLSFTRGISDMDVLIRMENATKMRALREGRASEAVQVIERLLLLDPGNGVVWQEAGLLHWELGNTRAAVLAFEHAVATMQEPALCSRVQSLLDEALCQLN
jgi:regulator of sirC expression with transglutaminase-like and TPR domain